MKRFRNGYSRRTDLHDTHRHKQKSELFSFQILSKVNFRAYFVSIPIHFLITFKFKRFPSFELPVPIPSIQPVERMSSRRTSEPGVIKSQMPFKEFLNAKKRIATYAIANFQAKFQANFF